MQNEMKLLVVDDDEDITDMVKFYCESKGLDCTAVNNGKDGLEVIRQNNEFDLILLDLGMPIMHIISFPSQILIDHLSSY